MARAYVDFNKSLITLLKKWFSEVFMLWVGNIRGRIELLQKAAEQVSESSEGLSVCGDLILKGKSPVECIAFALDQAENIIIGEDTMLLFQAMQSDKKAWQKLQAKGGKELLIALRPFESMVQDFAEKASLFYRDHKKKIIVVPNSIPLGFSVDVDFRGAIAGFFEKNNTHRELAASLKKSGMKTCLLASQSGINKGGVFYMNSGKNSLSCYSDETGRLSIISQSDSLVMSCEGSELETS